MNTLNKRNNQPINNGFFITSIMLLLAVICLIINYSINHIISWSLFPIGAMIVIWASIMPLFIMKRYKALGLFLGLTITLIPFILLIHNQVETKGWFMPLAMPIAVLSLFAFGISLFAFTHSRFNKFYAAALTIFLFGVVVNFGVGMLVNDFLNENNVIDEYRVTTMSVTTVLALILLSIGFSKRNKSNSQKSL